MLLLKSFCPNVSGWCSNNAIKCRYQTKFLWNKKTGLRDRGFFCNGCKKATTHKLNKLITNSDTKKYDALLPFRGVTLIFVLILG